MLDVRVIPPRGKHPAIFERQQAQRHHFRRTRRGSYRVGSRVPSNIASMETEIPNAELTVDDIPASARDLPAITSFALSFDGYAYWGEQCGDRAERAVAAFRQTGELPATLSALRACLFYEQGRLRWTRVPPDEEWTTWIQALLDAIRAGAER